MSLVNNMSDKIHKGTFSHRKDKYRIIVNELDKNKSWRIFTFNADISNISGLKEYDEIEYEEMDNNGIKICKVLGENRDIEGFFSKGSPGSSSAVPEVSNE